MAEYKVPVGVASADQPATNKWPMPGVYDWDGRYLGKPDLSVPVPPNGMIVGVAFENGPFGQTSRWMTQEEYEQAFKRP